VNIPDNFGLLFRQTEAKYRFGETDILGILEHSSEDVGVEIYESGKAGRYSGSTGTYFYRWEIEASEDTDACTVEETILASRRLLYLILLPPLLISLLLIDYILTSHISDFFLGLTGIITLSVYTFSFVSFLEVPSLLDETQERSEQYETGTSISRFNLLVVMVLFVGSLGVANSSKTLASLTVLATFGLVIMAFTRVQNTGTPLKPRKGIPTIFPPLLTSYLLIMVLFLLVPITALSLYLTHLLGYRSLSSIAAGYFFMLLAWYIMRLALTGDGAIEAYLSSMEEQPESEKPKLRIKNLIAGIIPSLILVHGYLIVVYLLQLNPMKISDALIILTGFIPGTYLLTGTTVQTVSFVSMIRTLLWNTTPIDSELDSKYNLRNLESDSYDAYSLSTFTNHYVILSEGLLNEFEEDELQSIIYHEESHIENGDSFLSFIIPILGLITFAPQGVLFESLDFRSREIRADREAYEKPDSKLEDTLHKLRRKQVLGSEEENSTISPFSGEVNENKPDEYRLFFGSHAIQEAHLSIPERIKRLQTN
jgi:Zn-dependent protease with chaperone function